MSIEQNTRQFCILIDLTDRSPEELQSISYQLKPFLEIPISHRKLSRHLADEPFLAATDLTEEEARNQKRRLVERDIPAEVKPIEDAEVHLNNNKRASTTGSSEQKPTPEESVDSWDQIIPDLDKPETKHSDESPPPDQTIEAPEKPSPLDIDLRQSQSSSTTDSTARDASSEHEKRRWLPVLLSILTPGAGQLYLGDEKRAHQFAVNSYKIYPWFQSVSQAFKRSQPTPQRRRVRKRNLVSFMLIWYMSAAIVVFGLSIAISMLPPPSVYLDSSKQVRRASPEISLAIERADKKLNDSLKNASAEYRKAAESRQKPRVHFTLSSDQRAKRLLRRMTKTCQTNSPRLCRKMANRLAHLDSKYSRLAQKIEVWSQLKKDAQFDPEKHETLSEIIAAFLLKSKAQSP